MVEIQPASCVEKLRPLFDLNQPDHPRLLSVLAGRHPGPALVDDPVDPQWCVVCSTWIGRTFIGGEMGAGALAEAISQLRRRGRVKLDKNDPHAAMFPTDEVAEDGRVA